jgi:hypothetical protein
VVLDVGFPVPLGKHDLAAFDDRHPDAGYLLARHLGLDDRVDPALDVVLGESDAGRGQRACYGASETQCHLGLVFS